MSFLLRGFSDVFDSETRLEQSPTIRAHATDSLKPPTIIAKAWSLMTSLLTELDENHHQGVPLAVANLIVEAGLYSPFTRPRRHIPRALGKSLHVLLGTHWKRV